MNGIVEVSTLWLSSVSPRCSSMFLLSHFLTRINFVIIERARPQPHLLRDWRGRSFKLFHHPAIRSKLWTVWTKTAWEICCIVAEGAEPNKDEALLWTSGCLGLVTTLSCHSDCQPVQSASPLVAPAVIVTSKSLHIGTWLIKQAGPPAQNIDQIQYLQGISPTKHSQHQKKGMDNCHKLSQRPKIDPNTLAMFGAVSCHPISQPGCCQCSCQIHRWRRFSCRELSASHPSHPAVGLSIS